MNLTPKSNLLELLQNECTVSNSEGWILYPLHGWLWAEVEEREARPYKLSAAGLEEALAWVAERSEFEVSE